VTFCISQVSLRAQFHPEFPEIMAPNAPRPSRRPRHAGGLRIGRVLSRSWSLYRLHFAAYSGVAVRATGWMLMPLTATLLITSLIVGAFVPVMLAPKHPELINWAMLLLGILLILPTIPLSIFCRAKYLYNEAIVARHAYFDLIDRPENLPQTTQALRRKMWAIWLTHFLLGLIISVINSFSSGFQNLGAIGGKNDVLSLILFSILAIILLAALIGQLWLGARLFLADITIAVEDGSNPLQAIKQSWRITQGNAAWSLMLVLVVVSLMAIPIYGLTLLVPLSALAVMCSQLFISMMRHTTLTASDIRLLISSGLGALGLYFVMLMLVNVVVMPFWATVKAAVYADLRD
jgi:hypothetical protein